MTTRDEAIRGAAMILKRARAERDALSPRDAAKAAWYPGHRLGTVEAIEELIIRQRSEALEAHLRKQQDLPPHEAKRELPKPIN
ncbi:hypothetical protein ACFZCK_11360 [Kitasatospora purpeofusca]|uniref:hypothetical protein n=1 Tax=Kitasatospora purpeofusca TaxID=67352 RepID=UPI0036EE2BCB